MKLFKLYFFIFSLLVLTSICKAQDKIHIGAFAGIQYGGPLPDHKASGTSGKAYTGPHAGIFMKVPVRNKWALESTLKYTYSVVDYKQNIGKRDTLYPLQIDTSVYMIPTTYTSQVSGRMTFHKLTLSAGISYTVFRFLEISISPYFSLILKGMDTLSNHIVVGDHYIDDQVHTVNSSYLKNYDFGIDFHADFLIYHGIFGSIRADRSFLNIYKSDYYAANAGNKAKFYHTYFYVSLGYRIGIK